MLLPAGLLFAIVTSVGGFVFDDPCEVWPKYSGGIPDSSDFTTSINVPSTCKNGTFRWDYPKGHVMVHFPNSNRVERKLCFGDFIGGDIFTIVDLTNGVNNTLPQFEFDSSKAVCTKPNSATDTLVRIDAPSTMYYVGQLTFEVRP